VTFGAHHYVPVLKVKRGEKKALSLVLPVLRARISPLLEIVERKPDKPGTVAAHLDNAFKGLAASVSSYARCFLDAREIAPDGPAAALEVFRRATSAGIVFTPVTGILRTADVAAALGHQQHGLALRLTREEFESGNLNRSLQAFMKQHGLTPEGTDLIIDLGAVDEMIVDGVAALTAAFLSDVPDHPRWRTFTVSACAFPMSMGVVLRHSHNRVERAEWLAWRDNLHERRTSLARLPTFSDCAIQYPKGVEGFDPRIMQMSASIRYAVLDNWLLIKGESTRVTRPGVQFPALATRLVYGSLRSSFFGPGHCEGCKSMKAAADRADGFGSPEAWRRLGTIHHISLVIEGLGALSWP
jgi:hypothetical protein